MKIVRIIFFWGGVYREIFGSRKFVVGIFNKVIVLGLVERELMKDEWFWLGCLVRVLKVELKGLMILFRLGKWMEWEVDFGIRFYVEFFLVGSFAV